MQSTRNETVKDTGRPLPSDSLPSREKAVWHMVSDEPKKTKQGRGW